MGRTVKRAFRYRFYPTPEQAALLARTFGCVRLVWNMALVERTRRYKDEGTPTSYGEAAKWLTAWKRDPALDFLCEVSNVPLQQALRHQQAAFNNFFSGRAGYPRLKSRRKSRASATFANNAFTYREGRLKLAKMDDPLDIRWSRPLPPEVDPTTVTVSRDAGGRWFVSILCEDSIARLPPSDRMVGIDAGITSLVTLSTGEKIANPRHERRDRERLAKAQRHLSRKARGSKNWEKARHRVARAYGRISDRRLDFLHKLSTRLVRENQTLCIEDLHIRNMVKNRAMARVISDAAWHELRSLLAYKADWYGRRLVTVDRWYPSSKLCSTTGCDYINDTVPLGVRSWTCPACRAVHDRDVNAAKNILAAGLAER
ncbi:RNA-guided endonuclease TnpB family protein [Actinomadura sp. K4S16]|uniref:RNA-guided endonuclease InsQ/TnpB family protein n=1 Tax=Actinomadura sp. K4S16 TaxID=1316147 RepID=UPI0011EDFFE0|nr:RNA-guided endonuclease TnpB family protein [Actinomadura sp. K4S16]